MIEVIRRYEPDDDSLRALLRILANERAADAFHVEDERALERVAAIIANASTGKTKRHGVNSVASHVLEAGDAIRPTG
jgi:hypothetical protein